MMSTYIIQITDTHIFADPAERFDGVDCTATLQATLAAIQAAERQPDIILLTGDLVHDPDADAYERLGELLTEAPAPVYCLPGNHDHPATMQMHLHTPPVRHDKHVLLDSWQILLLDSWLPNEHAGRLAQAELEWLHRTLAAHRDRHALITLHHPPIAIGSPWMDAMALQNPDDFFAVIDKYDHVRGVVWGHIHQVSESERRGVKLLGSPSTCLQFKPHTETYQVDDLAPGYRWLELSDDGNMATGVIRIPSIK